MRSLPVCNASTKRVQVGFKASKRITIAASLLDQSDQHVLVHREHQQFLLERHLHTTLTVSKFSSGRVCCIPAARH